MNLTLKEKINEGSEVYSFIFEPEEPVKWQAGQFMRYKLPHQNPDDRGENRFFSISSAPFEANIRLTTRMAGEKGSSFKKALLALAPGSQVEATGPGGDFILDSPNQQYVFLAGGIGITPFRSILLQLNHDHLPINIILLYANRTEEAIFKAELEALKTTNPNFEIEYVIEPQRIDESIVKARVPGWQQRIYFVSGPEPMVEAMDKLLSEMGISEENIRNDFFPNYTWP